MWYRPNDDPYGPNAETQSYWGRSEASARHHLTDSLKKADEEHNGTAEDEVGPLRAILNDYPPLLVLTVGAVGEGSPTLMQLIETMAVSYAQKAGLEEGTPLAMRRRTEFRRRALWCLNFTLIRMRHLVLSGRIRLVSGAEEPIVPLDEAVMTLLTETLGEAAEPRRAEDALSREMMADAP